MISSGATLVTKPQLRKPVGAEMSGKKGLTGGERVEREVDKNVLLQVSVRRALLARSLVPWIGPTSGSASVACLTWPSSKAIAEPT